MHKKRCLRLADYIIPRGFSAGADLTFFGFLEVFCEALAGTFVHLYPQWLMKESRFSGAKMPNFTDS